MATASSSAAAVASTPALAGGAKPLRSQKTELAEVERKLQEVKSERLSALQILHKQLSALFEELGGALTADDSERFAVIGDELTERRIKEFHGAIAHAKDEKTRRTAEAVRMFKEATELHVLLDTTSSQSLVDESMLPITLPALEAQKADLEWLRVEKARREEKVKDLARQISPLWDLLGVSSAERHQFFSRYNGLGDNVLHGVRTHGCAGQPLPERPERLMFRWRCVVGWLAGGA